MNNQTIARLAGATLASLLLAGAAQAQSAGNLLARVGVTTIQPQTTSGDLGAPSLAGTKVDVASASSLTGGFTYMLSDNLSVDLPLALPFKHEVNGAGAIAGSGKIGEVQALPITLLGQYRFGAPQNLLRPYVGAGLTYAKFFKARTSATMTALTGGSPADPTLMKVDSKLAATVQLGASLALSPRWSLDASATHTWLKTRATLSTGQGIDLKLDPRSYGIAVSRTF
ncbi:MAG: hypothetical protein RLZZ584_2817 [Pseudomonadota bacterium]|jgi:outer membrane protein